MLKEKEAMNSKRSVVEWGGHRKGRRKVIE